MEDISKKEKAKEVRKVWYEKNRDIINARNRTPERREKIKAFMDNYYAKYPWYKAVTYSRRKCNDVKHIKYNREGGCGIRFELTVQQITEIWNRDTANGTFRKPALERIDFTKNYSIDNVRFMEKYIEPKTRKTESKVEKIKMESNQSQEGLQESKV